MDVINIGSNFMSKVAPIISAKQKNLCIDIARLEPGIIEVSSQSSQQRNCGLVCHTQALAN